MAIFASAEIRNLIMKTIFFCQQNLINMFWVFDFDLKLNSNLQHSRDILKPNRLNFRLSCFKSFYSFSQLTGELRNAYTWFICYRVKIDTLESDFNLQFPMFFFLFFPSSSRQTSVEYQQSIVFQEEINQQLLRCPFSAWCPLLRASWKFDISSTKPSLTTWSFGRTTGSRVRFFSSVASSWLPTI